MYTVFAHVARSQSEINFDLDGYDSITVTGSCMTEEGFFLFLEGDEEDINDLLIEWTEMGVLIEESEAQLKLEGVL